MVHRRTFQAIQLIKPALGMHKTHEVRVNFVSHTRLPLLRLSSVDTSNRLVRLEHHSAVLWV